MKNNQERVRRDYTKSSLTTIRSYKRVRNEKVQIIEQTVRGNKKLLVCKECKKTFEVSGNRITRKFCSRNCYKKDWVKRNAGWNKGIKGQIAWNKGLTQETDERVRNYVDKSTKTIQEQFKTKSRIVNGYRHWKNTDIEIILQKELDNWGIKYKTNYPINLKDFVTFPDIYIQESKLCIYADGEYWHNYPLGNPRDKETDMKLEENRYKVLRFWGKEIKNNLSNCIKKVKEKI